MYSNTKGHTESRSFTKSCLVFFVLFAGTSGAFGGEVMPDFLLIDVNPASPTHDRSVSPRDYLQQTSGWYFGHAT